MTAYVLDDNGSELVITAEMPDISSAAEVDLTIGPELVHISGLR